MLMQSKRKQCSIQDIQYDRDVRFLTSYAHDINVIMAQTPALKRLFGYRAAAVLVLGVPFLMVMLWMTDSVPSSLMQAIERPIPHPPMEGYKMDEKEKAVPPDCCASCNNTSVAAVAPARKPKSLISYAYNETPSNRRNLQFLIQHGMYKSADWVFSFNGETDADELLPNHPHSPWYDASFQNIEVIKRENKCYDFGAHAEALLREWSADGKTLQPMGTEDRGGRKFYQKYERFILMNASVRGPFMPHWTDKCWSEAFWARMTEKVKLVGLAYNCHAGEGHLQSMVWATDLIGLSLLLQPSPIGIGYWCPGDMVQAIYGEIRSTPAILSGGYEVDALTAVYHSHDGDDLDGDGVADHSPDGYREGCDDEDFFHEGAYYGFNVHPYETIFMKSARGMQEALLGNLTLWVDGSGYESFGFCDGVV